MKTTPQKLACLTLALSLILAASGAMATQLAISSSQWETAFKTLLAYAEENGLPLTENTDFAVAEFSAPDGTVGYEHSLDLAGFMRVSYYDDGNDAFDIAILTINLDHGCASLEMASLAIYFTILGCDTETTQEEYNALMDAMCPNFAEVFSGEERINGMQAATLRGVGFALEISDTERFIKLYANVSLSPM